MGTAVSVQGSSSSTVIDLGDFGPTWAIAERDLRELMAENLRRIFSPDSLARARERLLDRIRHFDLGVPETQEERVWRISTTFTIAADVVDHEGRVLVRAGSYDIFDFLPPLRRTYIFIDATRSRHVALAKDVASKRGHPVVVLITAGDILRLYPAFPGRVYQATERLLRVWDVRHVPALVEVRNREVWGREIVP